MPTKKQKKNKSIENLKSPIGENLNPVQKTGEMKNQNLNHKKEALGPNTER